MANKLNKGQRGAGKLVVPISIDARDVGAVIRSIRSELDSAFQFLLKLPKLALSLINLPRKLFRIKLLSAARAGIVFRFKPSEGLRNFLSTLRALKFQALTINL